jgi:hypothetical protein
LAQSYRHLDSARVIDTIAALEQRIRERFPSSGLSKVCADLLTLARENSARAERIARRNLPLRIGVFALLLVGAGALLWIIGLIKNIPTNADNVYSLLQGIEAAANLTVLVGAALFFLVRSEERMKRKRALMALHELRSIVHVIDMHQLTKDPSAVISIGGSTHSSPARALSRFELSRYLDYCSEMVSLTSKLAVLFAQSLPDPIVTDAVSDIERIAAGLSQKIWQKIMILESLGPEPGAKAAAAAAVPAPAAVAAPASPKATTPTGT